MIIQQVDYLDIIDRLTEKRLSGPGREIVAGWIKESFENITGSAWSRRHIRYTIKNLSTWMRLKNHRQVAVHWMIKEILKGYTLDYLISSQPHSGSYLLSVGVGSCPPSGKYDGRLMEINIYGREDEFFDVRKIFQEASLIIEQRNSRQKTLF